MLKRFLSTMHQQNIQNTLVRRCEEHKACRGIFCDNDRIGLVQGMEDLLEFYDKNQLCTF
jgi:hypothetical protein